MKLSVLIPMYNAEAYIERCLYSLMHQNISKQDYEVIVFNDGSNDASKTIVENFVNSHSNVFLYSHKNEGVISTRNKLLKLAKGTYIYFMDADDYVAYNSLEEILEFSLQNEIDVMGFNTLVTKNETLFNLNTLFCEYELPKIVSGTQFLKENKNLRIEIWWFLIRKNFLSTNELIFNEDIQDYDGDVVFTLRSFLYAKKVAYSPISIYRYFQSEESTMRTANYTYEKRIAEYFLALIYDFSNLIDNLEKLPVPHKDVIKSNFEFRRDAFTFFTIIKMIRAEFSIEIIKEKLLKLESIKAYPIQSFIDEEYKKLKYKVLVYIFNHKGLLFTFIRLHKIYLKFRFKIF
ncbi:glycosyltransferase [Flavivirga amylovorans]|uniref:Glycosyltransferase n=1 Tax=Flavivirga amylovorans TaxID=870486 RepID=A0ABT8X2W9_9FLAO|nr:glycosyltransferase [Flavivirga amylovorans]MDO5987939.1 glycosyltransferase [Flavivirga amylovorans]